MSRNLKFLIDSDVWLFSLLLLSKDYWKGGLIVRVIVLWELFSWAECFYYSITLLFQALLAIQHIQIKSWYPCPSMGSSSLFWWLIFKYQKTFSNQYLQFTFIINHNECCWSACRKTLFSPWAYLHSLSSSTCAFLKPSNIHAEENFF